jgi:hypothetical protein
VNILDKVFYIFPYFFLGHLFGDYVIQTNYIAAYKGKSLKVLTLHILLVFCSQTIFLLGKGFALKELLVVIALSLTHFSIDLVKFLCKKTFCKKWYYYLFDQFLHIITLVIASTYFSNVQPFLNRTLAVVLAVSIFNGYFLSILVHFLISNGIYKRDYLGYFLRMSAPVFYIANIYLFIIYVLFCLLLIVQKSKESYILNYILTVISTVVLMEVML